jgi:uncharacterized protein YdaU (DUF1376 family)
MKKKIRYVSLEPSAFLSDVFFLSMSAEERGVYVSIILYLYENGGFLPMDKTLLGSFCNCENFEKVFEKIKRKFLIKNKNISHKRVLLELRRAKQISQINTRAGLKSGEARRLNDNDRSTTVQRAFNECSTKRSEEKRSEVKRSEKKGEAQSQGSIDKVSESKLPVSQYASPSVSSNGFSPRNASPTTGIIPRDLTMRTINFHDDLCKIFPQRTPSDSSSLRNLANWVRDRIRLGLFQERIIGNILAIARDSKKGKSRKPIAVFYAQLKTDLGYKQDG